MGWWWTKLMYIKKILIINLFFGKKKNINNYPKFYSNSYYIYNNIYIML